MYVKMCIFCRSLFILLSFFFFGHCVKLFFSDLRILITPLVSSNSIYYKLSLKSYGQPFHQYQQTEQPPLIVTHYTQKRPRDMTFGIQVLAWDRHTNVAEFNWLMRSQPLFLLYEASLAIHCFMTKRLSVVRGWMYPCIPWQVWTVSSKLNINLDFINLGSTSNICFMVTCYINYTFLF
jgi:hypothetical protein